LNGRRAKRLHRLAGDLQEAGLRPPSKARRLDPWLRRYNLTAPRPTAAPARALVRLVSGRALPPMPREAWTLPGRGPRKVGRPGPILPSRLRRDQRLAGRRITRQLARAAWRERQRKRRTRHSQKQAA
jgi:hypothetical protein